MSDTLKPINRRPASVPPPPAPVLSPALHYAVEHEDMSFAGALTETLDFLRTFNDRLHTERAALLRLRDDMEAENAALRAENGRLRGVDDRQRLTTVRLASERDQVERFAWFWFVLTAILAVMLAAFLIWD